jgi:hypothetical protein
MKTITEVAATFRDAAMEYAESIGSSDGKAMFDFMQGAEYAYKQNIKQTLDDALEIRYLQTENDLLKEQLRLSEENNKVLLGKLKGGEWISVKNKFPKPEIPVLVSWRYPEGGQQQGMSFVTEKWPTLFDHVYFDLITHWQPLPTPPSI